MLTDYTAPISTITASEWIKYRLSQGETIESLMAHECYISPEGLELLKEQGIKTKKEVTQDD